ncbi:MAG: hypothetical protein ACLU37_05230 [Collinsella sp.]
MPHAAGFVLTWFFGVDEQKINEFLASSLMLRAMSFERLDVPQIS